MLLEFSQTIFPNFQQCLKLFTDHLLKVSKKADFVYLAHFFFDKDISGHLNFIAFMLVFLFSRFKWVPFHQFFVNDFFIVRGFLFLSFLDNYRMAF
jgi:hypothetical protein